MSIRGIAALAATGAVIVAVRAALRIAPGPLLRWSSASHAADARLALVTRVNVNRVAWAVDRAGSHLAATCLERAIALVTLLRVRHPARTDARVVIGARTDPAFRAHAWVESCGTLFGGLDEPYASLRSVRPRRRQRD
jgi:hypothetical protein